MRSFAGIVEEKDSQPDLRLLQHLGAAIRLPGSSSPVLQISQSWGLSVVAHRDAGDAKLIVRDGEAWLAGDIRLDDRSALVRELGDAPPFSSDDDLVLRAWRRWGSGVVGHLFGDYSFVVWDGIAHELLCVRDRFGVRPFYYARAGRGLVFSDSLAAILAHPGTIVDELDDGAVADYLAWGVSDDAVATIYLHVRRLPPGHLLVHQPGGEIAVRQYWTPREPDGEPLRDDLVPRLEAALKSAIADRVTGTSAMVFMSGGLDSTTIAALAHESMPQLHLTAGTSVYRSRIPDVEEPFAREAARSIGIPIHYFPMDGYALLGALEDGSWMPEPGPLLMAVMTRDIYTFAATIAPVALHGHPADALLVGELTPFLNRLLRRGELLRFATALVCYTRIRRRPPYFMLRQLFGRSSHAPARPVLPDWLDPSFAQRVRNRNLPAPSETVARGLRPQAVRALQSGIWSSYFEWAHPLMTGAAIELAYPYCDVRVVELLMAAEPIPAMVDKHVLRTILRGRISETIRRRRKTSLQGDPEIIALTPGQVPSLDAATRYIDSRQFAESCRATGSLADTTLRAVAFDYWLRELHSRVRLARDVESECYDS